MYTLQKMQTLYFLIPEIIGYAALLEHCMGLYMAKNGRLSQCNEVPDLMCNYSPDKGCTEEPL